MPALKNQTFRHRLGFAIAGFVAGLRSEQSLRIQVVSLSGVLALLVFFRPAPIWWGLVALTTSTVICAELLNTALEHLADHLHPEIHPRIRLVKDLGAAAVLAASLGALAVAAALIVHLYSRSGAGH